MSMVNYASREINCKIVYYGPGLGGKTTNLEYVYEQVSPATRGKLISLATENERTLFFDFLRRMPEKQIRRDRRALNRDQHRKKRPATIPRAEGASPRGRPANRRARQTR